MKCANTSENYRFCLIIIDQQYQSFLAAKVVNSQFGRVCAFRRRDCRNLFVVNTSRVDGCYHTLLLLVVFEKAREQNETKRKQFCTKLTSTPSVDKLRSDFVLGLRNNRAMLVLPTFSLPSNSTRIGRGVVPERYDVDRFSNTH